MAYILDIILIAIVILCVTYGAKKGFFKALMTFVSGVCALLVAYTFTPGLSLYIKDRFIIDAVAKSLTRTFSSIAEAGLDSAGNTLYDLQKLLSDKQFLGVAERAGENAKTLVEQGTGGIAAVENIAYKVAEPLSLAVAEVISFILIFALALLALRLLTMAVGIVLKLPVLRTLDKTMGLVFGGVCALFFVWVFAMSADSLVAALNGVAPSSFGLEIIENSILVKFFANINPIALITQVL